MGRRPRRQTQSPRGHCKMPPPCPLPTTTAESRATRPLPRNTCILCTKGTLHLQPTGTLPARKRLAQTPLTGRQEVVVELLPSAGRLCRARWPSARPAWFGHSSRVLKKRLIFCRMAVYSAVWARYLILRSISLRPKHVFYFLLLACDKRRAGVFARWPLWWPASYGHAMRP